MKGTKQSLKNKIHTIMILQFIFLLSAFINTGSAIIHEDYVFIKAWPLTGSEGRSVYQMSLNVSDPTAAVKIVQETDDISNVGFSYNYVTRSVIWAYGNDIKSLSLDDNSITTLTDISGSTSITSIKDLGVDGFGNIYFTGDDSSARGIIGMLDTSSKTTQLHKESPENRFNAIAVDSIEQSVFGALQPSGQTYTFIKRLQGLNLDNVITAGVRITSLAVDIHDQNVYYSDGVHIFTTNYEGTDGESTFYTDTLESDITDLDVAGDYVYYVGKDNQNVMRINKHDATDMTSIGPDPGVVGINWVDVVLASETVILCGTTGIVHTTLSANCSSRPGESCDYTCNYGYERNPHIAALTCTDDSGAWNHNLSSLCRAQDGFIVVRDHGMSGTIRDVYLVPLYDPGNIQTIQVVDVPDNTNPGGVIFDGFRRSILWINGGVINSLSVDDDTASTLVDLSSGDFGFKIVADLALDSATGEIYFAGYRISSTGTPPKKGIVGVIDTNGVATEVYYVATDTFTDLAIDSVNRLIFPVIRLTSGTTYIIKKMDFNGSNEADVKTNFQYFRCIAVDVADEKVLWSDGSKIYKLGYDGSSEAEFYQAGSSTVIMDMKVVDDYIYYVRHNEQAIMKVHRLDASNVSNIQPTNGLSSMSYLDVPTIFGSSVTGCSVDGLVNTQLPANCTRLGGSCDDFECAYGYKKNESIASLNCSETGLWNIELSTLCVEMICASDDIQNAALPDNCTARVGETCDAYTCDYGYERNPDVISLNCTESGLWNLNLSVICTETFCQLDIPNGNLSSVCGNRVDDMCDTITCDYGYHKTDEIEAFNCTETGEWTYNVSFLCLETLCNKTIPNGQLSDTCGVNVGDTCNNFTCDYGFHELTGIQPFDCTEQGTWDYNMSSLCIETLCVKSIPNGNLSDTCGTNVGDTCDNFTCDYGFKEAENVVHFNCTESGTWEYNLSALCIEINCPVEFVLGEVSETCGVNVGDTCDNFTCIYGYREEKAVTPFECTESGSWSYNVSSLCTEILCPAGIPNGNLSSTCGRRVGDSCDSFTCIYGYHAKAGIEAFNCTEAESWDYDLSSLCIETICEREIPSGDIAGSCGIHVDDSCDDFACDYGYMETLGVGTFNCTESGHWDYNVSLLCTEILCNDNDIVNATLPGGCTMKVGETCDNFTCDRGYERNPEIDSLNCTEPGQWNYNLSTLCIETICSNSVPNGSLADACIESKVDESCDNFTCDSGFKKNDDVGQFNCTEDGTWDYDLTTLCTEILCTGDVLNGDLPGNCQSKAGESCDDFTCDGGFRKNESVTGLTCLESGEWSSNLSSLCIEVSCPSNVSNGQLATQCSTGVNATCDNITCDQGYTKNDDIISLVCTDTGTWDLNISFQCNSTMTSAINCQVTPPSSTSIRDWIDELGTSCGYNICSEKYKQVSNIDSVICMSDDNWQIYDTVRCSASDCSRGHSFRQGVYKRLWVSLSMGTMILKMFIY